MLTTASRDQIVRVKKTLQEDEERYNHFLDLLEKWMDCHAFLPKNYDKRMLPIYLRNCKYDLDKTKRKLELYFVYKKRYPQAFCYHEFNDAEKRALDNYYAFESTTLTPEGYRVACAGFRSPDTTGCDMNAVNKLMAMLGAYKANLDVINCGIIVVINFQNLSPSIVSGITNPFFMRLLDIIQKVCPFRMPGIYLTFLPGFAVPIANMVKMILGEKLGSRVRWFAEPLHTILPGINKDSWEIHLDTGNERMKEDIPNYCLPLEFGGTNGTINENAAKFIQEVVRAKPWFLEQARVQMMGDIPKHLYKISGIDDNFGAQGSFRKLTID